MGHRAWAAGGGPSRARGGRRGLQGRDGCGWRDRQTLRSPGLEIERPGMLSCPWVTLTSQARSHMCLWRPLTHASRNLTRGTVTPGGGGPGTAPALVTRSLHAEVWSPRGLEARPRLLRTPPCLLVPVALPSSLPWPASSRVSYSQTPSFRPGTLSPLCGLLSTLPSCPQGGTPFSTGDALPGSPVLPASPFSAIAAWTWTSPVGAGQ